MTPKTNDPRLQLLKDASEYMREVQSLDARSSLQKLLDTLRSSRALVSNMAAALHELLKPEPVERKRRGKQEKEVELAPGLNDSRKEIFYSPVSRSGWQNGLILAIHTGKAMGFDRFEIDLDGDLLADEVPDPRMAAMRSMFGQPEDDWRTARSKEGAVPVIRLYAWIIR